jgi:hypothetical protein
VVLEWVANGRRGDEGSVDLDPRGGTRRKVDVLRVAGSRPPWAGSSNCEFGGVEGTELGPASASAFPFGRPLRTGIEGVSGAEEDN